MPSTPSSPAAALAAPHQPSQHGTYRKYLTLQDIAQMRAATHVPQDLDRPLAGRLLLSVGMGAQGMELALATTIAGGVFLGIDSSPQNLKLALRNGACNFMVNTLDEALRVLKNELRKHAPLSVGLLGDAGQILPAMVERGVQPDFLADTSTLVPGNAPDAAGPAVAAYLAAFPQLADRGAVAIHFDGGLAEAIRRHSPRMAEKIVHASRSIPMDAGSTQLEMTAEAANHHDLRLFDGFVTALLPEKDWVRRTWLAAAPACFHRQTPLQRVIGLRPEEIAALLAEDRKRGLREQLTATMYVRWIDTNDGARKVILEPLR